MFHIIDTEEFLKTHSSDTCYGIKTGKCKCRYTHCHKYGCYIYRNAKHFEKSGYSLTEDLEWGSDGRCSICTCRSTSDTKCQYRKQTLKHHRTISDFQHIFFIFHSFRRCSGRNQTMESGNRTTGNGDKQDWEHRTECLIIESCVNRKIHARMSNKQTNYCTRNHSDKHKRRHVITRLFQKPHWKYRSKENIYKCNVTPGIFAKFQWTVHTDHKGKNDANDTKYGLFPTGQIEFFLNQSEDNSKYHKHY